MSGSFADAATITGGETLMILAARPGDEVAACGGLIAELCRRGRPPFVMVLSDEPTAGRARATAAGLACLGLPAERLLMVGLFEGMIPLAGPVFEAVVGAVVQVMWRMDCNVVARPMDGDAMHAATAAVAEAVAVRSGVGRLGYAMANWPAAPGTGRRFAVGDLAAKRDAVAAHAGGRIVGGVEVYLQD